MKQVNVGDEFYYLFAPTSNLPYRYYKGKIESIVDKNVKYRDPNRNLKSTYIVSDILQVLNGSDVYVNSELKHTALHFTYTQNNQKRYTIIDNIKDADKIYFLNELSVLENDIEQLNDILNKKKELKEELQKYVDEKLQDWNYRGTIKI